MYVCEVFKGEKRKEQAASSGPQTEAVSVAGLTPHATGELKSRAQRIRGVSGGPDKLKWNFQCNNCN